MNTSLVIVFAVTTLAAVSSVSAVSFSQSGDIIVSSNGRIIKCDKIFCPKMAAYCVATKVTDPKDANKVIRTDKCFGKQNKVLKNFQTTEANPSPGSKINVRVQGNHFKAFSTSSSSS